MRVTVNGFLYSIMTHGSYMHQYLRRRVKNNFMHYMLVVEGAERLMREYGMGYDGGEEGMRRVKELICDTVEEGVYMEKNWELVKDIYEQLVKLVGIINQEEKISRIK